MLVVKHLLAYVLGVVAWKQTLNLVVNKYVFSSVVIAIMELLSFVLLHVYSGKTKNGNFNIAMNSHLNTF